MFFDTQPSDELQEINGLLNYRNNHNVALLAFVQHYDGINHIKTFEQFYQLSVLVNKDGYKTHIQPEDKNKFDAAVAQNEQVYIGWEPAARNFEFR